MSYRHNSIDIIVGVGLCAILCGALLVFAAANGTYHTGQPQAVALPHASTSDLGMSALQPAFGQALLDQAVFERQANQAIAQSVSEWNRATLAWQEFASGSDSALGSVMHSALTVPLNHLARVEWVKGRGIVDFSIRGIRNGLLSGDHDDALYNTTMINMINARGQRLHEEFASTWQTTLGHRIVEAAQQDWLRARTIQERLGVSLVHVVQTQLRAAQGRAMQQEQLASLIFASVHQTTLAETTVQPSIPTLSHEITVTSTLPASWPEIPMTYVIAAGLMLAMVFWGSLSMAVQHREAKALAQLRRDADQWVYRLAA